MQATQSTRSGVTATVSLLGLAMILIGMDPIVADEPTEEVQVEFEIHPGGIPLFNKLPYVNKLFTQAGVAPGSDVECCRDDCDQQQAATAVGEWIHVAGIASEPCAVAVTEHLCPDIACAACAHAEGAPLVALSPAAGHNQAELWERLMGALEDRAHLEATLEAREAVEEEKQDLVDSLVEAAVENARLEAKLELAEERLALQEQLTEAVAENALLQAKLEVATKHQQVLEQLARAAVENEKLKMQIANLELIASKAQLSKQKQVKAVKLQKAQPSVAKQPAAETTEQR